ncbi:MAG: SMI1/KNR4 family protein [Brevefilum sp.]
MADLLPITESLAKLQAWANDNAPEITFNSSADPDALENYSEKSGIILPEDLRRAWLVANGETRKSAGMIGNWRLMPIAEIQAAWGLLTKIDEKGGFAGKEPTSSPYLRHTWWHASWIPVVASDTGYYFCIATSPPEIERAGQILLFLQDRPERPLIAGSLQAWFDRILHDLETGLYTFDPKDGFNGEAFMWSALEGKHLFDGKEKTIISDKS